jgi:hypothetical protein
MEANVCHGCHQVITGDVLQAMNMSFHPDCLLCTDCKAPIINAFVNLKSLSNDVGIHNQNTENISVVCTHCAELRIQNQAKIAATPQKPSKFCEEERKIEAERLKNIDGLRMSYLDVDLKEICPLCHKSIFGSAAIVNIKGRDVLLHEACLKCTLCHKSLLRLPFIPEEVSVGNFKFWHASVSK